MKTKTDEWLNDEFRSIISHALLGYDIYSGDFEIAVDGCVQCAKHYATQPRKAGLTDDEIETCDCCGSAFVAVKGADGGLRYEPVTTPAITEQELELMAGLLKVSRCPNCDGSGTEVYAVDSDGSPDDIGPCEWCHRRTAILAKLKGGEG